MTEDTRDKLDVNAEEACPAPARPPGPRAVAVGAAFWLLFAAVLVCLRGVRWDENYEFAQALLGIIPYPKGHPLYQHAHNAFSFQTYSLAALIRLLPESLRPLLANGVRNVLYIAFSTIPVYLLAALVTRRTRWGHAAALLTLLEIHANFYSCYPIYVWPKMSTNGGIGLGYGLLALYFLAAGRLRVAYFLAASMPAIHIGQFPPVLGLFALHFLGVLASGPESTGFGRPRRDMLRDLALGGGAGLAITLGFFLIQQTFASPPPTAGPYFSSFPADEVWKGFLKYHTYHRALRIGLEQFLLVGAVLLGIGAIHIECRARVKRGPWLWLGLFACITTTTVWLIMAIHYAMKSDIPYLLISWMPYRLSNYLAPLMIVMMIGLLAGPAGSSGGRLLVVAALALAIFKVPGEWLVCGLTGASLAAVALAVRGDRRFRWAWAGLVGCAVLAYHSAPITLVAVAAGVAILGLTTKYGHWLRWLWAALVAGAILYFNQIRLDLALVTTTACALVLALDGLALRGTNRRLFDNVAALVAVAVSCLVVIMTTVEQARSREHLPITPFEHRVRAFLDERGEPDVMIAIHPYQWQLQARLHHPVITDAATRTWIPYHKSLGPTLHKMYWDLYRTDFAPKGDDSPFPMSWEEAWAEKSAREWQALAREYSFGYLLAPKRVELHLPIALEDDSTRLYRVPTE